MNRVDAIAPLFELDPDLGAGLDPEQHRAAEATLRVALLKLDGPVWDPAELGSIASRTWLGLLVTEGLMIRCVTLGNRSTCELIGPGDLIRPWDMDASYAPLEPCVQWRVPALTRIAVLDGRFTQRAAAWPSVTSALMGRAASRARSQSVLQVISQFGRTDARLLALFWILADRWGTVSTTGIRISLPLTHELLANLIAVRRPSVSLALARLARAGLLERESRTRWRLNPAAAEHLEAPERFSLEEFESDDALLGTA